MRAMTVSRCFICFVTVLLCWVCIPLANAGMPENMVVINGDATINPDPGLAGAGDWYDTQVTYNLYSPLVYATPEGSIRPHIAQDWGPVDNNLSVWRFTLRQGIKFHDGSEVTAEDVVFSMDRLMKMGKGYSGTMGNVIKSTAVGPYKVEFTLERPSAIFPYTLVSFWIVNKDLLLKHIQPGDYGEFGDYGQEWLATHDAGSGPYIMIDRAVNERLIAKRFEDYFLGWEKFGPDLEPIDKIMFVMVSEPSTVATMIKARQIDLDVSGIGKVTAEMLTDAKGIEIKKFPSFVSLMFINTQRPPTDDLHFRKAITYAFSYDVGTKLEGGKLAAPVLTTLIGHDEQLDLPRQDLQRAKEELALSKYDPAKVTVTTLTVSGNETHSKILLQLHADLAKVGIRSEIKEVPWMTLAGTVANLDTTPNGAMFMLIPVYPSADSYLFPSYHPIMAGGMLASHWMKNEELGRMIDQSRLIADEKKRNELYKKIQRKIVSLAPAIYISEAPLVHSTQEYLSGPREIFPTIGPNINMHNFQINLKRKQALLKR